MKKILFALLAATMLIGCQEKKDENVIKIGAILPLTGYAAYSGQLCAQGLEFALDSLNSAQSKFKYELVVEDCKSMVPNAVSAYRRLEMLGVQHYVVFGGQFAMGIAPLAKDKDVIIFAMATPNLDVLDTTNRMFRLHPTGETLNYALSDFAFTTKNYRSTSIIYMQNEALLLCKNLYSNYYTDMGGIILAAEGCETDARDYKDIITKISHQSPECIFVAALGESAGRISKQISSIPNLKTTPILGDMNFANPNVKASLSDIDNEVYYVDVIIKDSFINSFVAEYNETPNAFSALSFSALEMFNRTLNNVGTDISAQLEYLKLNEFETVVGNISFEDNGEIHLPVRIYSY